MAGGDRQPEKPLGVARDLLPERRRLNPTRRSQTRDRERDVRRLVSPAAMRHRRQIGGVRLGEEAVRRHESKQRIVGPLAEGDDAAEGDVPAGGESTRGECVRARVAVQDARDAERGGSCNHLGSVALGGARVDDKRAPRLRSEVDLRRKGSELALARRVVVVVIEAALADGHRAGVDGGPDRRDIAPDVECGSIVWMHAGGRKDEPLVVPRQLGRPRRRGNRFPDADNGPGASVARAVDDRVAIRVERRVGEVGVAVDEGQRTPAGSWARAWRCRSAASARIVPFDSPP